tara:strand:+ start:121 stop:468 length:348 start_codon:yes stop_codon:yes gene_type:complete
MEEEQTDNQELVLNNLELDLNNLDKEDQEAQEAHQVEECQILQLLKKQECKVLQAHTVEMESKPTHGVEELQVVPVEVDKLVVVIQLQQVQPQLVFLVLQREPIKNGKERTVVFF